MTMEAIKKNQLKMDKQEMKRTF